MKKFALLSIAWLLTGLVTQAQLIYPIKADSVRIYNTKDTAELILENHTQKLIKLAQVLCAGRVNELTCA